MERTEVLYYVIAAYQRETLKLRDSLALENADFERSLNAVPRIADKR